MSESALVVTLGAGRLKTRSADGDFESALNSCCRNIQRECDNRTDATSNRLKPFQLRLNHTLSRSLQDVIFSYRNKVSTEQRWLDATLNVSQQLADIGQYKLVQHTLWQVLCVIFEGMTTLEELLDSIRAMPEGGPVEHVAKAAIVLAQCVFGRSYADDKQFRQQNTIESSLLSLDMLRAVMEMIQRQPRAVNDRLYYLIFDASVVSFVVSEVLVTFDAFAAWKCYPIIAAAIFSLESHTSLANVTFVAWRCRLYGLLGRIYDRCGLACAFFPPSHAVAAVEDAANVSGEQLLFAFAESARQVCDRGVRAIAALKRLYMSDPPVLDAVMSQLDQAKAEMCLRKFRYDSMHNPIAALEALPKLIPQQRVQLLALLGGITFQHSDARRILLPTPPGSESSKCKRTCLAILGHTGVVDTSSNSGAAEVERVNLVMERVLELLAPFCSQIFPCITLFVQAYIDAITNAKTQDSLQLRRHSALPSGFVLRSALRKSSEVGARSEASPPISALLSACSAFESSTEAEMLPHGLHLHLLMLLFSFERWTEFDFFLHAMEARLEAKLICVTAPDTVLSSQYHKTILLRRARELAVGKIPAPLSDQLKTKAPEVESASAKQSGKPGQDAKAQTKDAKKPAGKEVKPLGKLPDKPSSDIAGTPAAPAVSTAVSISPIAFLSTEAASAILPALDCTAVQVQAFCDALTVCSAKSTRSTAGLSLPGMNAPLRGAQLVDASYCVFDDADLLRDAVMLLERKVSPILTWRDASPTTLKRAAASDVVDEVIQLYCKCLFRSAMVLSLDDTETLALWALQHIRCCMQSDQLCEAVQACRSTLRVLESRVYITDDRADALTCLATDITCVLYSAEARLSGQSSFQDSVAQMERARRAAVASRKPLRSMIPPAQKEVAPPSDQIHLTTSQRVAHAVAPASQSVKAAAMPPLRWLQGVCGFNLDDDVALELICKVAVSAIQTGPFAPSSIEIVRLTQECRANASRKAALYLALLPYAGELNSRSEMLRNCLQQLSGSARVAAYSVEETKGGDTSIGLDTLTAQAAKTALPAGLRSTLGTTLRRFQRQRIEAPEVGPTQASLLPAPAAKLLWSTAASVEASGQVNAGDVVIFYGKPVGAGTAVAVTNDEPDGTGVPIICGSSRLETRLTSCVINGLLPNERYHFAYAVKRGDQVDLSATSAVINTSMPLDKEMMLGYAAIQAVQARDTDAAVRCALTFATAYVDVVNLSPGTTATPTSICFNREKLGKAPRVRLQLLAQVLCIIGEFSVSGMLSSIPEVGAAYEEYRTEHRLCIFALAAELALAIQDPWMIQVACCGGMSVIDQICDAAGVRVPPRMLQPSLTFYAALATIQFNILQRPAQRAQIRLHYLLMNLAIQSVGSWKDSLHVAWSRYMTNQASLLSTIERDTSVAPAAWIVERGLWPAIGSSQATMAAYQVLPSFFGGQANASERDYIGPLGPLMTGTDAIIGMLSAVPAAWTILQGNMLGSPATLTAADTTAPMNMLREKIEKFTGVVGNTALSASLLEVNALLADPRGVLDILVRKFMYSADGDATLATGRSVKGKEAPPKDKAKAPPPAMASSSLLPVYRPDFLSIALSCLYLLLQADVTATTTQFPEVIEPQLRRLLEVQASSSEQVLAYEQMRREDLQNITMLVQHSQIADLETLRIAPHKLPIDSGVCYALTALRPVLVACITDLSEVNPALLKEADHQATLISSYQPVKDEVFRALCFANVLQDDDWMRESISGDDVRAPLLPHQLAGFEQVSQIAARYGNPSFSLLKEMSNCASLPLAIRTKLLHLSAADLLRCKAALNRLVTICRSLPVRQRKVSVVGQATQMNSLLETLCSRSLNVSENDEPTLPQAECLVTPIALDKAEVWQSGTFFKRVCLSAASDAAMLGIYVLAWGHVYEAAKAAWACIVEGRLTPAEFGGSSAPDVDEVEETQQIIEWTSVPSKIVNPKFRAAASMDWVHVWRIGVCICELITRGSKHNGEPIWGVGAQTAADGKVSASAVATKDIAELHEYKPSIPPENLAPTSPRTHASSPDFGDEAGSAADGSDSEAEADDAQAAEFGILRGGLSTDDVSWMCKYLAFASQVLLHAQQWKIAALFGLRVVKVHQHVRRAFGGADAFSQSPDPATPDKGWSGVSAGCHARQLSAPAFDGDAWDGARKRLAYAGGSFSRLNGSFALAAIDNSLEHALNSCFYASKIYRSFARLATIRATDQLAQANASFSSRPSLSARPKHRRASILEQMALLNSEESAFEVVAAELKSRIRQSEMLDVIRWRTLRQISDHLGNTRRDMTISRKQVRELRAMSACFYFTLCLDVGIAELDFSTACVLPVVANSNASTVGVSGLRKLRAARQASQLELPAVKFEDFETNAQAVILQLRKRRETVSLVQAILLLGNARLMFATSGLANGIMLPRRGLEVLKDANLSFVEAVDAIFGASHVVDTWHGAFGRFPHSLFMEIGFAGSLMCIVGCSQAVSSGQLYSKLAADLGVPSKAHLNKNDELELSLLAAAAVYSTFYGCTIIHPRELRDFSRHRPTQWLPSLDVFADERMVAFDDLSAGLRRTVTSVLAYGEAHAVKILPTCCAYEYLATYASSDPNMILDARILRCQAQIYCGDIAGAVETMGMIFANSAILMTEVGAGEVPVAAPVTSTEVPSKPSAKGKSTPATNTASPTDSQPINDWRIRERQAATFPVFFNHLPPGHPWNRDAIEFLALPPEDPRVAFSSGCSKVFSTKLQFRAHLLRIKCLLTLVQCLQCTPVADDVMKQVTTENRASQSTLYDGAAAALSAKGYHVSVPTTSSPSASIPGFAKALGATRDKDASALQQSGGKDAAKSDGQPATDDSALYAMPAKSKHQLAHLLMSCFDKSQCDEFEWYFPREAAATLSKGVEKKSSRPISASPTNSGITSTVGEDVPTGDQDLLAEWLEQAIAFAQLTGDDRSALVFATRLLELTNAAARVPWLAMLKDHDQPHLLAGYAQDWHCWTLATLTISASCLRLGAVHKALQYAQRCNTACEAAGDLETQIKAQYLLSTSFLADGEPEQAIEHFVGVLTLALPNSRLQGLSHPARRCPGLECIVNTCLTLVDLSVVWPSVFASNHVLQAIRNSTLCSEGASTISALLQLSESLAVASCEENLVDLAFWEQLAKDWCSSLHEHPTLHLHPARLNRDSLYDHRVALLQRSKLIAAKHRMQLDAMVTLQDMAFVISTASSLAAAQDPFLLAHACALMGRACWVHLEEAGMDCMVAHSLMACMLQGATHLRSYEWAYYGMQTIMQASLQQLANGHANSLTAALPAFVELHSASAARIRNLHNAVALKLCAQGNDAALEDGKEKGTKGKEKESAPADVFERFNEILPRPVLNEVKHSIAADENSGKIICGHFGVAPGAKRTVSSDITSAVCTLMHQQYFLLHNLPAVPSLAALAVNSRIDLYARSLDKLNPSLFKVFTLPQIPSRSLMLPGPRIGDQLLTWALTPELSDRLRNVVTLLEGVGHSVVLVGPYVNADAGDSKAAKAPAKPMKGDSVKDVDKTETNFMAYAIFVNQSKKALVEACLAAAIGNNQSLDPLLLSSRQVLLGASGVSPRAPAPSPTKGPRAPEKIETKIEIPADEVCYHLPIDFLRLLTSNHGGALSEDAVKLLQVESTQSAAPLSDKKPPVKAPAQTSTADRLDRAWVEDFDVDEDMGADGAHKQGKMRLLLLGLSRLLRDGEAVRCKALTQAVRKSIEPPPANQTALQV